MAGSTFKPRAAALPLFLLTFKVLIGVSYAQAAPWSVETLKLPSQPVHLFMSERGESSGKLAIKTRNRGWFYLGKCGEKTCVKALKSGYKLPASPRHALPDAVITTGSRNILAAWLAGPTRRYAHGVLGDAIEAGRIVVEDAQRKRHRLTLAKNAVFEDRFARLADLDGDGGDEIIVVKSYLTRGAALAVLKLNPSGLEIAAETPPIGRAHRWLNPAGIADYDGDGRNEVAIVVTPHIGGILQFWEYRDGALHAKTQRNGFSNHVIGSRAQQMSVSADFNGDGVVDLALPSQDRKTIRIISLAGGAIDETARIRLPGRVVTEIRLLHPGDAKGRVMVMGFDTGQLAIVRQ